MKLYKVVFFICLVAYSNMIMSKPNNMNHIEDKIHQFIKRMTLDAKIGQMIQKHGTVGNEERVRRGEIGSILNEVDLNSINEMQRIAVQESPFGIPLLFGRDVIHGFRTIFPIPLGMAATWNPDLVEEATRISAIEAASVGLNWTFAPMIDISRDPRWGRIAETLGEDPYLTSVLATSMVKGFQTDDLTRQDALAACAKHFVGYGAAEGGRDYNTVYIPEQLLREIYLPPFKACLDAGAQTLMPAFNDLNGIPATGNPFLLKKILQDEWNFKGLVVSDWGAIEQMIPHGFCEDSRDAAKKAALAGIDMEMATDVYGNYLKDLVESGEVPIEVIDNAVRDILRVKFNLNLFDNPYTDPSDYPELVNEKNLQLAKEVTTQSIVLLQNDDNLLPLSKSLKNIAVMGPLADDPFEQLGTWTFDKNIDDTITLLQALKTFLDPDINIHYEKVFETSRSKDSDSYEKAIEIAEKSDVVLLFMGEEAIITGEAHCRANINLPGAQETLIHKVAETNTPIALVVMAGRPLTMGNILEKVDAILYAFHPGTMGGPAIVDLLFGEVSPSGKLPVTFPKVVGQIPIYYNHKNTGRPPSEKTFVGIDDIPVRAFQTSLGNESHYIDAGFKPQYPFGFGLSYTQFEYSDLKLSKSKIKVGDKLTVSAKITNTGSFKADEIVQLYIQDLVATVTRPVKELKGFERICLKPGESKTVEFIIDESTLSFIGQEMKSVIEPGKFNLWIAKDSESGLPGFFEVIP